MGEAFVLTGGAVLLTVEISCLQSVWVLRHAYSHCKPKDLQL